MVAEMKPVNMAANQPENVLAWDFELGLTRGNMVLLIVFFDFELDKSCAM
jgi:hypothetical protein